MLNFGRPNIGLLTACAIDGLLAKLNKGEGMGVLVWESFGTREESMCPSD